MIQSSESVVCDYRLIKLWPVKFISIHLSMSSVRFIEVASSDVT